MKFCGAKCRAKHYRTQELRPVENGVEKLCDICGTAFVKTKRNARYCSPACYKKSWSINNREKAAEKSRLRRLANPSWYESREPGYYKTYRAKSTSKHPWKYLFNSRRRDAIAKKLPFDLDDDWARLRWNNKCEITGITFRQNGARGPHPFSPSLDRIIPTLGYIKTNCRFILWGCNALKGVGSDDDMYEIARAISSAHSDLLFAQPARTGSN